MSVQKVIGVRLKKAGKIHLYDPGNYEIARGDSVIVETAWGLECASVAIGIHEIPIAENPEQDCCGSQAIKRIRRKATQTDLLRLEEIQRKEQKAFEICERKIGEHKLPMNLINVKYTFDSSKITFYFTAEGRVDFRDLVKDLAKLFHNHIELRQVGVRDEARLLGGIGCCGRPLCCATFLGDFVSVSIRMAKEQNLSLNPTKISGICGRLLCCLKYESDYYHKAYVENMKNFQFQIGNRVIWSDNNGRDNEGKIVAVNAARKTASILLNTNKTVTAEWTDLMPLDNEDVKKIVEEQKTDDTKVDVEVEGEPEKVIDTANVQIAETKEKIENIERHERPRRSESYNRSRSGKRADERQKSTKTPAHVENLYGNSNRPAATKKNTSRPNKKIKSRSPKNER